MAISKKGKRGSQRNSRTSKKAMMNYSKNVILGWCSYSWSDTMLFVGKLPTWATRHSVWTTFGLYGTIKKVIWPVSYNKKNERRQHKGHIVIEYKTSKGTEAAIAANDRGDISIEGSQKQLNVSKLDKPKEGKKFFMSYSFVEFHKPTENPREVVASDGDKPRSVESKTSLFIGGLDYEATMEDMEAYCSSMGKLACVIMPTRYDRKLDTIRHRSFAYVEWADGKNAQKALDRAEAGKLKLRKWPDKTLSARWMQVPQWSKSRRNSRRNSKRKAVIKVRKPEAKSKTVSKRASKRASKSASRRSSTGKQSKTETFVGGVPHETDADELTRFFSNYGTVQKIIMPTRYDKKAGVRRHRGFCYIKWGSEKDAMTICKIKSCSMSKYPDATMQITPRVRSERASVDTKLSSPRSPRKSGKAKKSKPSSPRKDSVKKVQSDTHVFAGGISPNTSKEQVEKFFKKFGKIAGVFMPSRYDKKIGERRHRGFAYIEFAKPKDAKFVVKKCKKQGHFTLPGGKDSPVEVIPRMVSKSGTTSRRRSSAKSSGKSTQRSSTRSSISTKGSGKGKKNRRKQRKKSSVRSEMNLLGQVAGLLGF